jgi:hypothetical protein
MSTSSLKYTCSSILTTYSQNKYAYMKSMLKNIFSVLISTDPKINFRLTIIGSENIGCPACYPLMPVNNAWLVSSVRKDCQKKSVHQFS